MKIPYLLAFFLILNKYIAKSTCLENIECYICPFNTYDSKYNDLLRISYNQGKDLTTNDCILKENLTLIKKIVILNSEFCIDCQIPTYDAIYNTIGLAFYNESLNSLKYIYSNLNFYLQNGDHFINENDLINLNSEFFRRTLVDITLQSLPGFSSNVFLKTNKFFIFISKNFRIENISFYGNDLNLNDNNPCLTEKTQLCCLENQLNQTFTLMNNSCGLIGKQAIDSAINVNYGLFNLEYIFDNPNMNEFPYLSIMNSSFKNFFLLNNTQGFGSVILLTSYSGKVLIDKILLINCYFIKSFIYYLNSDYDLYDIIKKNLIIEQISLKNIDNLKESIIINNSNIIIINPFLNEKTQNDNNLIGLMNWKGDLIVENTIFDSIYSIPQILQFTNDPFLNGTAYFKNSVFGNIKNSSIFLIENILIFSLTTVNMINCINIFKEPIQLNNIAIISIDRTYAINIFSSFLFSFIKISQSNTQLNSSFFFNSTVNSIISQSNNNLFINNCTFQNISFSDAITEFSFGGVFTINQSYFQCLTGKMSIFYVRSSDKVILQSVLVKNTSIYSVFFLMVVNKNLIYDLYVTQNSMILLWSSDQTCANTFLNQSYITQNIFSNFYINFNIPNIIAKFDNLYIHTNDFTSTALIRLYLGNVFLNKLNLIENFFTNSKIFLMVLNFSKACQIYLNNSYFESNGVTTKKTYYVGFTDNCFISMGLGVKLTIYDNLTMIATDKIEMVSGFFSGDTHGGLFQLTNSRLIILSNNRNFGYKGIYMGDFVIAKMYNNSFYNLLCNKLTKLHMHGSVFMGSSSSYIYVKNTRSIYFYNNSFFNCSCYFGGGLAIIGLQTVEIENCSFYNSSSINFGGHLLLIASEKSNLKNIVLNNSIANEGAGLYFLNIFNLTVKNISLMNAFSKKNGVIFCRLVMNFKLFKVITINTSTLQNGGFLYIMNGIANISDIIINYTDASLSGGSIYTHGSSSLELRDVIIENSYASTGGSINIENSNYINITNCSLISSSSTSKGAGIFVNSIKLFILINITIQRNINFYGNGVILIQTDDESANIMLKNVTCLDNYAFIGSCLYYFSSTPLTVDQITIDNCKNFAIYSAWSFQIIISIINLKIQNIQSNFNLISITEAKINCFSWNLENNDVLASLISFSQVSGEIFSINIINNSQTKAFQLVDSVMEISEFSVVNDENFMNKIGFFNALACNMKFSNGIISNNYDNISYIASFIQGNLIFENLTIKNTYSQVLSLSLTNFTLRNCSFNNNTGLDNGKSNDIVYENLDKNLYEIMIERCIFEVYSHNSLNFEGNLNISIKNSIFTNKNPLKSPIFSLYLYNFYGLWIISSNFSYFTDSVIKIFTDNLSKMNITNTSFISNIATIGTSVYISGTLEIFFEKCIFLKNYAYIEKNSTLLTGIAPAVFFKPLNISKSKINIFSCDFIENTAEYIAPTVFSQIAINNDKFNTFSDNNYLFNVNFTKNLFSFPIGIKEISYIDNENETIILNSTNSMISLKSGEPFNLTLQLIDYFEHVLTFDNATLLMIKTINQNNSIYLENNIAITKCGIIEFRNFIIKTQSDITFSLVIEGILAKIGKDGNSQLNSQFIQNFLTFQTKRCFQGEILLNDSTCFKCKENTFSLIDPMEIPVKYQKCYACPENSYCLGGYFITPLSGYYRKSRNSLKVVPCINSLACIGLPDNTTNYSDPAYINGACSIGSYGPVCYYCNVVYGKYQNNDYCSYCDIIIALVYTRLGITALFIVLNIIISVSNIENYSKKHNNKEIFNNLTKIIINHSQSLMLIIRNSLSLPEFTVFKNFFNIFDYFSFLNIGSFLNECFLNGVYYNPQKIIVYLSIYAAFIPFIVAFLGFFVWLFIALSSKYILKKLYFEEQLKNLHKKIFSKYIIYLLLSAYMFYPLILKSSFTLIDCFKLDPDEVNTYLRESPYIECWGSEHLQYISFYGLPGVVLWGVGFPIFLLMILRKNKKYIKEIKKTNISQKSLKMETYDLESSGLTKDKNHPRNSFYDNSKKNIANISKVLGIESLNSSQTLHAKPINKNLMIYSFFYCGYRSKFYYWESLIFFRKFFLTFVLTLDQKIQEEYKWIIVFSLLFLPFQLTMIKKPYKIKFLNKLELFSLGTCILTAFISALSVSNENSNLKSVFNIICIGSNIIFYVISVLFITNDFYRKFKKQTKKIKDYFARSFKNEKIEKISKFSKKYGLSFQKKPKICGNS